MPMIPEDIMTALQSLAASENMNDRQRTIMTEAAAIIKFQQHRVSEAEKNMKDANADLAMKNAEVLLMTGKVAEAEATTNLFRKHLAGLAAMTNTPDFIEEQKHLHPPLIINNDNLQRKAKHER